MAACSMSKGSDVGLLRSFTKILLAMTIVLASLLVTPSVVSLARAEGTACESRGFDLADCDRMYITDLDRRNLTYNEPGNAIRIGHVIADYLAGHPTMKGVTVMANKIIKDNPGWTPQMAVSLIKVAVHYYGPPGLEERLESAASAA